MLTREGWTADCTICGAWVSVLMQPKPNEIDVGGPAVAVGCNWPNGVKPN